MRLRFSITTPTIRVAHASRVLASASSRSRTFSRALPIYQMLHNERLFRRDAETSSENSSDSDCRSRRESRRRSRDRTIFDYWTRSSDR